MTDIKLLPCPAHPPETHARCFTEEVGKDGNPTGYLLFGQSAPVGVEGWRVEPVEDDPDMLAVETPDGRTWFAKRGDRVFELAEALALAQQPAAVDDGAVFRLAVWMAKNEGHDDPHRLIWEGSPPEPWGEFWQRYEDDARAALTAALTAQQGDES